MHNINIISFSYKLKNLITSYRSHKNLLKTLKRFIVIILVLQYVSLARYEKLFLFFFWQKKDELIKIRVESRVIIKVEGNKEHVARRQCGKQSVVSEVWSGQTLIIGTLCVTVFNVIFFINKNIIYVRRFKHSNIGLINWLRLFYH